MPARGLSLRALIPDTGPVTERVRVREIDDDEGQRLVRIVRRGGGSVVTWRRAQMVLLSAQGMEVPAIAKVAFTSEDRVRPREPQGAGQHDPPVHHLAQQPCLRRTTPPHRRPGKRSLMRHQRGSASDRRG